MRALRILMLALLFAAGLWYLAWWSVPLVAALWALVRRDRAAPREATLGALLATVVLLARQMISPAFGRLLAQLGELFPVPGIALMGFTLLLATLLAFTGARVVTGAVGAGEHR